MVGSGEPVVCVDFDDAEHLSDDLTGCRSTYRGTNSNEREALPPDRDDG